MALKKGLEAVLEASANGMMFSAARLFLLRPPPPIIPCATISPDHNTRKMLKRMAHPDRKALSDMKRYLLTLIGAHAVSIVSSSLLGGAGLGKALEGATALGGAKASMGSPVKPLTIAMREGTYKNLTRMAGADWGRLALKHLLFQVDRDGSSVMIGADEEPVKRRKGLAEMAGFTYSKLLQQIEKGATIKITTQTRGYAMFQANKFASQDYGVKDIRQLVGKVTGNKESRAFAWYALATTPASSVVIPPRPFVAPAIESALEALMDSDQLAAPVRNFLLGWATGLSHKYGGLVEAGGMQASSPVTFADEGEA